MAEPLTERRSAGHGVLALAAEGGPQLAVDEPVEDAVLGPDGEAGAAALEAARPGDGDVGGPVEDLAAPVGDGSLRGGVEHLLEDARDGEDEGRPEGGEVVEQVLDVGRVAHPDAGLDAADLDDPGEDVGERQEQQRGGAFALLSGRREQRVELVDGDGELEHEVAVGEHAALGASGGARGVDQGGEVDPVLSPYDAPRAARR